MLGGDHLLGGAGLLAAAEAFDLGDAAGVMTTPRQPRLESSSTAQIRLRALVSPGKRPITLVRRRTSTKVRSSRFVERIRLRCSDGQRRCATRASRSRSMTAIADGYAS